MTVLCVPYSLNSGPRDESREYIALGSFSHVITPREAFHLLGSHEGTFFPDELRVSSASHIPSAGSANLVSQNVLVKWFL